MPQSRFELDSYSARVLDVVKGKYGLKNRQQAFKKFVEEHGGEYAQMRVDEQVLRELDVAHDEHIRTHGFQTMSDDELNRLLGL